MKRLLILTLLFFAFLTPNVGNETLESNNCFYPEMNKNITCEFDKEPEKCENDQIEKVESQGFNEFHMTATVYHPVPGQTDSTPLTTADGSKIDLNKLKSGKLKWIAMSRDMLERWGGDFDYGDKVKVISDNPKINGVYEIHDTMNKRFENRIDILTHKDGIYGKWNDIKVRKV